jgi:hypothetical protein
VEGGGGMREEEEDESSNSRFELPIRRPLRRSDFSSSKIYLANPMFYQLLKGMQSKKKEFISNSLA